MKAGYWLLLALSPAFAAETLRVGSGALHRSLSGSDGRTAEISGPALRIRTAGEDFRLLAGDRAYTIADFRLEASKPLPDGLALEFRGEAFDVEVDYSATAVGGLRKSLRLRARRDTILKRVDVESLRLAPDVAVTLPRTIQLPDQALGNTPFCAFLDQQAAGAFLSLDFAYGDIDWDGRLLRIGYQPFRELHAGETYETHSVTAGAYRLAGRKIGLYDRGAAEAYRHYLRFAYAPPRWPAPQLVYTSIVNRYTELDPSVPPTAPGRTPIANTIFYTLSDANYYMLHPDRMYGEIDFCKSLSMEFCQVYEGPFEWIPGNPAAEVARQIGDYARDRGVRLGLYTGANQLTAPHFNDYAQDKGRPEWRMLDENGKRGPYCWGSDEFTRWFADVLIHHSLAFNFRMANFDFLKIAPCYDQHHGHAPGRAGLYRQVANLVWCLEKVRSAVPGYVYDSNLGWPALAPKVAPWMDAFYFTDPHVQGYFPSLNATEVLDDSRRSEMVSYFLNYLTPVEYFRNCEYYVVPDSVLPDATILEYGILQGLAVTPNLQLGETRALFDRLSPSQQEQYRRFLGRWTEFVKDHFDYYADTRVVAGPPRLGSVEIYAHAKAPRSIVFLVNPNPMALPAGFALDGSIGIAGRGPFQVRELYPEDELAASPGGVLFPGGAQYRARVPARTVEVLEIGPLPGYAHPPLRVAGAPATWDRFADHYRVRVEGPQGRALRLFLALPANEHLVRIETEDGPLAAREVPGGYALTVKMPKGAVEPDVRRWRAAAVAPAEEPPHRPEPAGLGDTLDLPELSCETDGAEFLGAHVENLLNERFAREFLVYFTASSDAAGGTPEHQTVPEISPRAAGPARSLCTQASTGWWYSAEFPVAFVQRFIPPAPGEHNYISLNFKQPGRVQAIRAWLNGSEARVETYHYWRGSPSVRTWYLDGTRDGLRRGRNTLTVWVRYGDPSSAATSPARGR